MFGKNLNQTLLVTANVLLVFFLIALSNLHVLPLQIEDFVFFALLTLALALYRPSWAFLFFVGTSMLENINLAPLELGIAVRPYQFFGGITILALLIRWLTKRLNFKLIKLIWPDYLVMLMGAASFLSVINSPVRGVSLKQSIVLLSFMGLYFLARNFLQTIADIKKVIPFFLSSSAIVALYGIWQNIRFAHDMSSFEVMAGRPNATFTEADWLGIYLVMLLVVAYSLIYSRRNNNQETNTKQITNHKFQISKNLYLVSCFLYLAIIYALLIMTVSRSAWLGALGVTFIFLLSVWTQLKFQPKNWQWREVIKLKIIIIPAFLISITLVYFFHLTTFQLGNRLQSTGTGLQKITISCQDEGLSPHKGDLVPLEDLSKFGCKHINLEEIDNEKVQGNFVTEVYRQDPNVSVRSEIYKKSWDLIKGHPILGIGWGSVSVYLGTDSRGAGLNASNIFLEIWLGAGFLGLASFVALLIIILIRALHSFVQADPERKTIGLFLLLGFFAILIPNMFNSGIMLGYLWLFLGGALVKK
jgi:hypothetical protein